MNTLQLTKPDELLSAAEDAYRKQPALHYFSCEVAKEQGIPEAILLLFLSRKVAASRNHRDGKKFYFGSVSKEFAHRFPYLKASRIHAALRHLAHKRLIVTGRYNRLRGDRTGWYHVDTASRRAATKHLIGFEVEDAVRFGVPAAILLHHLAFQLASQNQRDATAEVTISPTRLSRYLPLSPATIKRVMARLVTAGVIRKSSECRYIMVENAERRIKSAEIHVIRKGNDNVNRSRQPLSLPELPSRDCRSYEYGQPGCERFYELIAVNKKELRKREHWHSIFSRIFPELVRRLNSLTDQALTDIFIWSRNPDELLEQLSTSALVRDYGEFERGLCMEFFVRAMYGRYHAFRPGCLPLGLETELQKVLVDRMYPLQIQLESRIWEERRATCQSSYRHVENDRLAAPTTKASAVIAGAQEAAATGILYQHRIVLPPVKAGRDNFKSLVRFFEDNRGWTAGELLKVFRQCIDVVVEKPQPEYNDPYFYARKGCSLWWLLSKLEYVLQELGESELVRDLNLPEKDTESDEFLATCSADHLPDPQR